ncbi:MAG: glycosyltransferase [Myxococcota bacterium]
MKVALVLNSLYRGGAEGQLISLAKSLHAAGVSTLVVLFYSGSPGEDELRRAGVSVHSLGKSSRWDSLGFFRRVVGLLKREQPDIFYGFLPTPNILAAFMKPLFPRMRIVWGVRSSRIDLTPYGRFVRGAYALQRLLAPAADLIIANSFAGRDYLLELGYPRERTLVIANGFDTQRFSPDPEGRARVRDSWGFKDEHWVIGLVARADPVKGHELFLSAAARAAALAPELRFVCVGLAKESQAALRVEANRLGLAERLVMDGSRPDVVAVYSALDVLCMCSFSEGFPNVVAEAMACGVPCVVSDVGDAARIVEHTGLVVPTGDVAALAQAFVESLTRLCPRRFELASAARQRIVDGFEQSRIAADTIRHLEAL